MISFTNPGEIDIHAITTLGVNVKETSSPIGFFGTGLKFAIAVLLREAQSITIFSGLTRLDFHPAETSIRGKMFSLVMLSQNSGPPRPLGFTTDLGKNWTLANAYRELYSNMRDEGGEIVEGPVSPQAGQTIITITGDAFREVHNTRSSFILSPKFPPLATTHNLEMFPGSSSSIFFQSIQVYKPEKPTAFTYNFLNSVELTEDRTAKYPYMINYYIAALLSQQVSDKSALALALSLDCFEKHLDYSCFIWSDTFTEVLSALIKERPLDIPPNLRHTFYSKRASGAELSYELYTPTPSEQAKIEEAVNLMTSAGLPITKYPITVYESLGQSILGMANSQERKILLSRLIFNQYSILQTLLEEFIHLESNAKDETREFQDFTINLLASVLHKKTQQVSEIPF